MHAPFTFGFNGAALAPLTDVGAYEPGQSDGRARCDLRLDLLHGDGLPRLPCHRRHDLPDRVPCRAIAGQFTPERHFGFEAAAWYWHFVDVVWLFLFACIYVWGAGSVVEGMTG